jgi:hypothetical protein
VIANLRRTAPERKFYFSASIYCVVFHARPRIFNLVSTAVIRVYINQWTMRRRGITITRGVT